MEERDGEYSLFRCLWTGTAIIQRNAHRLFPCPFMADGPVIELATLPERHPRTGAAILRQCSTAAVLRLSLDPTRIPRGRLSRDVTVDRDESGANAPEQHAIGWSEVSGVSEDDCARLANTFNEQRITEDAAIAIMALLIHALETVTVETVVPIGSGGDYLGSFKNQGKSVPVQIEVSGLREDESGGRSSERRKEKREQVLTRSDRGYVSVSTFKRLKAGMVHSSTVSET